MAFIQTFNAGKTRLKSLLSRASTKPPPPFAIKEESLARYCPGGYHPVRIGDTFKEGKYLIVNKLGYGLYSTVWLARNVEQVSLPASNGATMEKANANLDQRTMSR